jgi:phosphate:Na+ symporter
MIELLDLAGWIALLLWGLHMVQSGTQRVFGADLRRILGAAMSDRLRAFATGLGVTALLQSSTATGMMVAAFSARGLVDLVPALAVMLGANLGTTLIVQILAFDIAIVAPVLILAGVVLFRRAGTSRLRDFGRVPIGLGLMMLGLSHLAGQVQPWADDPAVRTILGVIGDFPLIAVILAAAVTWAAHSSVAIVLLLMSFAARGALPLDTALAMVLGANLGTAVNPLIAVMGNRDDLAARRLPMGNLLNRLVGAAIILPLIPLLTPLVQALESSPARGVANFHTAFNLATALLALPLLPALAKLLGRWLPDRPAMTDRSQPIYLDRAKETTKAAPTVALTAAAREALRMADVLEEMLRGAAEALSQTDRKRIAEIRRIDDVLDRLNNEIKAYLSSFDVESLAEPDRRRLWEIITFTANLEQAGDAVDRDVMVLANKRLQRGIPLPDEARAEVVATIERLEANLASAAAVFLTDDMKAARTLADEKEVFRDIEARSTEAHFARLRGGGPSAESSGVLLELVRALKRVNSYIVAAAAYPVLEDSGDLLRSRLKQSHS